MDTAESLCPSLLTFNPLNGNLCCEKWWWVKRWKEWILLSSSSILSVGSLSPAVGLHSSRGYVFVKRSVTWRRKKYCMKKMHSVVTSRRVEPLLELHFFLYHLQGFLQLVFSFFSFPGFTLKVTRPVREWQEIKRNRSSCGFHSSLNFPS